MTAYSVSSANNRRNGASADAPFRRLFAELTEYAVIVYDAVGRVTAGNAGGCRAFGWRGEGVLGRTDHVLFAAGDVRLGKPEAELALMREGRGCEEEGWLVRRDGSSFWASVVLVPLGGAGGGRAFEGYAKIVRDITDRKKGEW